MESGSMTMKTYLGMRRIERLALGTALESAGFLVFDVSDGGRDRDRLREFWAALIILDLPMPRLGGLEVFRRLRDTGDGDPEVIILTHDRIPDTIETLRLGVVDVLVRPLKPEALRTAVEEIIRRTTVPLTSSSSAQRRIFVAAQPSVIDLVRSRRAIGSSNASRCSNPERLNPIPRKINYLGEPEADVRDASN
jgi:DNA-binding response OmpR family regulator